MSVGSPAPTDSPDKESSPDDSREVSSKETDSLDKESSSEKTAGPDKTRKTAKESIPDKASPDKINLTSKTASPAKAANPAKTDVRKAADDNAQGMVRSLATFKSCGSDTLKTMSVRFNAHVQAQSMLPRRVTVPDDKCRVQKKPPAKPPAKVPVKSTVTAPVEPIEKPQSPSAPAAPTAPTQTTRLSQPRAKPGKQVDVLLPFTREHRSTVSQPQKQPRTDEPQRVNQKRPRMEQPRKAAGRSDKERTKPAINPPKAIKAPKAIQEAIVIDSDIEEDDAAVKIAVVKRKLTRSESPKTKGLGLRDESRKDEHRANEASKKPAVKTTYRVVHPAKEPPHRLLPGREPRRKEPLKPKGQLIKRPLPANGAPRKELTLKKLFEQALSGRNRPKAEPPKRKRSPGDIDGGARVRKGTERDGRDERKRPDKEEGQVSESDDDRRDDRRVKRARTTPG